MDNMLMCDFKEKLVQMKPQVEYQLYLKTSWDQELVLNNQELWPTASLIKLGIAVYGQNLALKQTDLLGQKVALQPEDIVGGAGTLQFLTPKRYSIGDLLLMMIIQSDNTATNALLSAWGLSEINFWLNKNYPQVLLQRRLMEPAQNGENLATAKSLARLLAACFNHHDAYAKLLQFSLQHQMDHDGLVWPVSCGKYRQITTYNKTGELLGFDHDAARFTYQDKYLDCVVLTRHAPNKRPQAIAFLQQIGTLLTCLLLNQK